MPTDPVCGETFTEEEARLLGAETVEHGDKTLYFCGPYCKRMYEAEPEKYAENVRRELASGQES